MGTNSIPIGKLPADLLKQLLDRHVTADPRVLLGPGIGEDAAIIDMGDRCLVAATDPITYAAEEIGWYAVHINANDVASCGATPRWFLATVLLPPTETTRELTEAVFDQLADACRELGVTLCGGHTEVVHGLTRPIIVGQMLGEVPSKGYITTGGAQVEDVLILTKGIAIEGTAILAREKRFDLHGVISEEDLSRCADWLREPGISVVKDAQLALEIGGIHALHDPTEGGVATGLWELAEAARVGVSIDERSLPVMPECRAFCRHFGLDPLGLIASGALLIAADKSRENRILGRLQAEGIAAATIGEVTAPGKGCLMRSGDNRLRPLPRFPRDEITRVLQPRTRPSE